MLLNLLELHSKSVNKVMITIKERYSLTLQHDDIVNVYDAIEGVMRIESLTDVKNDSGDVQVCCCLSQSRESLYFPLSSLVLMVNCINAVILVR